jgi:hypothetical protein
MPLLVEAGFLPAAGAASPVSLHDRRQLRRPTALRGRCFLNARWVQPTESSLAERTYCVLATGPKGRPQARPVAFTVFGAAAFATALVAGQERSSGRRASLVISEGEGEEHRMAADGPVTVVPEPPDGLLELWESRMGRA